ncbi:DUF4113 domain-containing protein [Escherichia coli]|nr:DUF4113 domain-containing protein [Escherichia coli]
MTWKDRLQDASFRGVPFKVEEESAGTGRRVETHEYPNRDKPYIQPQLQMKREMLSPRYTTRYDDILRVK